MLALAQSGPRPVAAWRRGGRPEEAARRRGDRPRIRVLRAIARHATPEVIAAVRAEEDEIEASIARHSAWVVAGRPGEEGHEDVERELLA